MEQRHKTITLRVGHDELIIRQRYEVLSIGNDMAIAVWFIIGSIMFMSSSWTLTGTWLFLAGSVQLLIRPLIRLVRHVHLRRIGGRADLLPGSDQQNF